MDKQITKIKARINRYMFDEGINNERGIGEEEFNKLINKIIEFVIHEK